VAVGSFRHFSVGRESHDWRYYSEYDGVEFHPFLTVEMESIDRIQVQNILTKGVVIRRDVVGFQELRGRSEVLSQIVILRTG
jgi:hypothetical protein